MGLTGVEATGGLRLAVKAGGCKLSRILSPLVGVFQGLDLEERFRGSEGSGRDRWGYGLSQVSCSLYLRGIGNGSLLSF